MPRERGSKEKCAREKERDKRKDMTGRRRERVREREARAWLGKVFPTSVLHHPDSRPIMLR